MNMDREKLNKFAVANEIKFIVLFGSRAKEAPGKDSDFDIAVLTSAQKTIADFENYKEVLFGLSEILGIPDHKTDLTNLNSANILLRYEITSKGELLYGDKDEYEQFKAFSFKDYIDAKPLFALEDFLINKRQKLIKQAIEAAI